MTVSSDSDISQPELKSASLSAPNVLSAEEERHTKRLLPSQERHRLKPYTSVTEPLVVGLVDSPSGVLDWNSLRIILPRRGSNSLQDCILVTPQNWELSGLPSYWIYMASDPKSPLGLGGALSLSRTASFVQSAHHWAWSAASSYVDRRYKSLALTRVQRRSRIDFWMSSGWGGTEQLKPVLPFSSKTLFQHLKSLAISKWCALSGRT